MCVITFEINHEFYIEGKQSEESCAISAKQFNEKYEVSDLQGGLEAAAVAFSF